MNWALTDRYSHLVSSFSLHLEVGVLLPVNARSIHLNSEINGIEWESFSSNVQKNNFILDKE